MTDWLIPIAYIGVAITLYRVFRDSDDNIGTEMLISHEFKVLLFIISLCWIISIPLYIVWILFEFEGATVWVKKLLKNKKINKSRELQDKLKKLKEEIDSLKRSV
jgi:hypothetical protein